MGSFKLKWPELQKLTDDMPEYGNPDTSNAYKAASALNCLYARDYRDYDSWKNIGIAFKAAGGELSEWLAWSSTDTEKYNEEVATRLFNSVSEEGAITALTLWDAAWKAGWKWRERYEKMPQVRTIPDPIAYDSEDEQAIDQLNAMFEPDDYANIVTYAKFDEEKKKWKPGDNGKQYKVSELCDAIREQGLENAIGGYNHEAGVWVRVNPMDGKGTKDANVQRFANALVESDDIPLKDQERMLFELDLPIVCITSSGGKSLHAIVRVDADGKNHYSDRVLYMHNECNRAGMSIDGANKNPSRLTRLAGIQRGEQVQALMHMRTGARDFRTWMLQEKSARLSYDYGIEPIDMENPPILDEVLIDGVMRRGDKMCVAGPSKAYKSFSLVQLAIAVASGGSWFGWKCKQGRVLYINCELRGESFRKRVWEVAENMHGADRDAIAMNMDVWNMRGRTKDLSACKDTIIEQAESRNYDVVILDPIYKLFTGDENSAQEVSAFMASIDELTLRLHASVAYCHHHSKGAKGGVSAQDRFSGSGVFARDCDELIDISPLDLGEHTVDEWGFDKKATAWRIETVIRDFAPKQPLDVIFEHPIHIIDETGYLSEFNIRSPQTVGGNKRGKQLQEKKSTNIRNLEKKCKEHYGSDAGDIPLTIKDLEDELGYSARTIKNWALESDLLRVQRVGNNNYVLMNKVEIS